jgi:hypothetical protein
MSTNGHNEPLSPEHIKSEMKKVMLAGDMSAHEIHVALNELAQRLVNSVETLHHGVGLSELFTNWNTAMTEIADEHAASLN